MLPPTPNHNDISHSVVNQPNRLSYASRTRIWHFLFLLALALTGALMVYGGTRWGPALGDDSFHYIGAAQSSAHGRGLRLPAPNGVMLPRSRVGARSVSRTWVQGYQTSGQEWSRTVGRHDWVSGADRLELLHLPAGDSVLECCHPRLPQGPHQPTLSIDMRQPLHRTNGRSPT